MKCFYIERNIIMIHVMIQTHLKSVSKFIKYLNSYLYMGINFSSINSLKNSMTQMHTISNIIWENHMTYQKTFTITFWGLSISKNQCVQLQIDKIN